MTIRGKIGEVEFEASIDRTGDAGCFRWGVVLFHSLLWGGSEMVESNTLDDKVKAEADLRSFLSALRATNVTEEGS
jgi:hypothetical protein